MQAGVYEPLPGVVGWCCRQVCPDLVGVGVQADVQHASLGGLWEGQGKGHVVGIVPAL